MLRPMNPSLNEPAIHWPQSAETLAIRHAIGRACSSTPRPVARAELFSVYTPPNCVEKTACGAPGKAALTLCASFAEPCSSSGRTAIADSYWCVRQPEDGPNRLSIQSMPSDSSWPSAVGSNRRTPYSHQERARHPFGPSEALQRVNFQGAPTQWPGHSDEAAGLDEAHSGHRDSRQSSRQPQDSDAPLALCHDRLL